MSTEVLPPSERAVRAAAARLRAGEVVALPSETVYGLAAIATDEAAAARIFEAKERPSFDPLIVHVPEPGREPWKALVSPGWVDPSALDLTARRRVEALSAAFWPGPLTLVLPAGPSIPGIVTSGLDTVAIRSPRHPVFQAVLRAVDAPLAAPSANRFGRISPTRASDVFEELAGRIPLIIDGGPTEVGLESTILRLEIDGGLTLLRAGGLATSALEAVAGCPVRLATAKDQIAPGRLASHYAPGNRLRPLPTRASALDASAVHELLRGAPEDAPVGLLVFEPLSRAERARLRSLFGRPLELRVLGEESAPAARALFRSLRELDRAPGALLFAEPITRTHDLWPAITERLSKAMA